MTSNWKKGDILILNRKGRGWKGYGKFDEIGDQFILENDWNTYVNMIYISSKSRYKFSILKKDLKYSFTNLRIKRENAIDKALN